MNHGNSCKLPILDSYWLNSSLGAASSLKVFEENGEVEFTSEENSVYNRLMDIKRCWVKYGLALLEISADRVDSNDVPDVAG